MAQAQTNQDVVERYARASAANDLEAMASLRHADWVTDWPQSGERVRGSEAYDEIRRRYPGGHPSTELSRIIGSEDRWVVTPGNTVLKVVGSGDVWWGEWRMTYPDGQLYHVIDLIELRDGLVSHETVYWASPFEAPEWRRPFVEPTRRATDPDPR